MLATCSTTVTGSPVSASALMSNVCATSVVSRRNSTIGGASGAGLRDGEAVVGADERRRALRIRRRVEVAEIDRAFARRRAAHVEEMPAVGQKHRIARGRSVLRRWPW